MEDNVLSQNLTLLVILVILLVVIAAARAICRQAHLRSTESGYIYFATCIVCHVVYRVNVVIQGESFVCSTCFHEQRSLQQAVPEPRLVDVDLAPKYLRRVTSTFFEISSTKPVEDLTPTDACTICFDKAASCVILSCGHGGLCEDCADSLLLKSQKCHICRNKITSIAHCGQGGTVKFGRTIEF